MTKAEHLIRDHRLIEALDEARGAMTAVQQAVALRSDAYRRTATAAMIERHVADAAALLREATALANLSVEKR